MPFLIALIWQRWKHDARLAGLTDDLLRVKCGQRALLANLSGRQP